MTTKTSIANAELFFKYMLYSDVPKSVSELKSCDYRFGFKTVFYACPYSYRCCGCAFEHEYFTYVVDKQTEYRNISKIDNEDCNVVEKRTTERNSMKDAILDRNIWEKETSDPNETSKENANLDMLDEGTKDRSISNKQTEKENGAASAIQYKSIPDLVNDCIDQNDYDTKIEEKETFARILQSIREGQCEHVGEIPEDNWECITETMVYGMHVIAAVQSEQNIQNYIQDIKITHGLSGVFSVHPFATFLMKNKRAIQCHGDVIFRSLMNIGTQPIMSDTVLRIGTRLDDIDRVFRLEAYPVLEICAKLKNTQVLHSFVEAHLNLFDFDGVVEIMETVINHRLVNTEKILMDKLQCAKNAKRAVEATTYCAIKYLAETSIMKNRPDILDDTLAVLDNASYDDTIGIYDQLFDTCRLLKRDDCKSVITKYYSSNSETSADQDKVWDLLLLLSRHPDLKDDIKLTLSQIPNIQNTVNRTFHHDASYQLFYDTGDVQGELFTPLEFYTHVNFRNSRKYIDSVPRSLLHTLFEIGASADAETSEGQTLLATFLNDKVENGIESYSHFRNVLEEILYSNPRTDDETYVDLALMIDASIESQVVEHIIFNVQSKIDLTLGNYYVDCNEHSLFGFGDPGQRRFAFNFTVPLLLECGFSYSRDSLEKYLGYEILHPDENSYLRKILEIVEEPRRLDLQCRDRLRKHFQGHYIHDFVSASYIPKPIKDFILLRDLLSTLKH